MIQTLEHLCGQTLDAVFFGKVLQIIMVDIVLAGDNAIVIAMAVQALPPVQRRWGIILGCGAAVVLRIIFTAFMSMLLAVQLVQLLGGAAILWIGYKLLADPPGQHDGKKPASNLWKAIWMIVITDVTMSLDNILAVAGASEHNMFLLIFGLIVSIPLVVFASSILSRLMHRFPIIVYIGAGLLGYIGAKMMLSDPIMKAHWPPSQYAMWVAEALACIVIVLSGWRKRVVLARLDAQKSQVDITVAVAPPAKDPESQSAQSDD